jgi:uncharacterized membrane protein YoaK (UPF0700 family)
VVATTLTVVAGIADAVGYMTMGGVFAANMTGNTVLAGIAVAQWNGLEAWHHLVPLLAFFGGAMLARLLLRLTQSPRPALVIEAATLAAVGFLPVGEQVALLAVAAAMGAQASAITRLARSTVSTVVVTSTLARGAEALLDFLWPAGQQSLPAIVNRRLLALTWIGYLAGAVAGALLIKVMAWPLLVPAALLVLLLI